MLKHVDTGAYLAASGQTFGRPINGQMEIVGLADLTAQPNGGHKKVYMCIHLTLTPSRNTEVMKSCRVESCGLCIYALQSVSVIFLTRSGSVISRTCFVNRVFCIQVLRNFIVKNEHMSLWLIIHHLISGLNTFECI